MIEIPKVKAKVKDPNPDPFTGKRREVEGYYFKHEGPSYAFNEGQDLEAECKHYIISSGFADWNMERPIEMKGIDITTMEYLDGTTKTA